jgi:hypothetical protein
MFIEAGILPTQSAPLGAECPLQPDLAPSELGPIFAGYIYKHLAALRLAEGTPRYPITTELSRHPFSDCFR